MRLSDTDHDRVTAAVTAGGDRDDRRDRHDRRAAVRCLSRRVDALGGAGDAADAGAARVPPGRGGPCLRAGRSPGRRRPQGALYVVALVLVTVVFLAVRLVLAWTPARLALTPGATKARRVRRRALLLFRAGAEKRTKGSTGVLLYLSLAEHRAEIIADDAIHSRVPNETWGDGDGGGARRRPRRSSRRRHGGCGRADRRGARRTFPADRCAGERTSGQADRTMIEPARPYGPGKFLTVQTEGTWEYSPRARARSRRR